MAEKPMVKLENIVFNLVDESTGAEVDQESVRQHNLAFIQQTLIPLIMDHMATPCECQMPKIIERSMNRARLLKVPPAPGQLQVNIEQSDIDMYTYHTVIHTKNSAFDGLVTCTRECNACHRLMMHGSGMMLSSLIGQAMTKYYDRKMSDSSDDRNDEMAEDAESGVK